MHIKKIGFIIWFEIVHQVCNCLHTFVFNFYFMDKGSSAMAMAMDASWFESNCGLCNKGRNIFKLTIEHATIEEIWKCLRPCSNKNGWHYDQTLNEEEVKLVEEFDCKVASKAQPPNYRFSIQFAKAMVCEAKGIKLNWATFGAHLHEFCSQIQELKKNNTKKKIGIPCY